MPTPVPSPDSHYISLAEFQKMKDLYSLNQPDGMCTSETFNNEAVETLQSVDGCAGLRIYYGMSDDLVIHAMLVACDKDGNDILPQASANFTKNIVTGGDPVILEDSQRCPPAC